MPRRRRRAAERQSRLIFVAFRRAPEDAGDALSFNILAEGWDQVMRRGVGKGRSWVSPVYCLISPPNQGSHFCVQGPNAQQQHFSDMMIPVGLMETRIVIRQVELCPIWSLKKHPST